MTVPIALQLYTLRRELVQDFSGVTDRIAAIGYKGVEPAYNHLGASPAQAARRFEALGLALPSAHTPLPLGEDKNSVLDFMSTLSCKRLVSGKGPDAFATLDLTLETCDLFNEAYAVAIEHGFAFGIHNHWWEFLQVEGRYVYEVMLERLEPGIFLEIDTYWVQTAGVDPVVVVRELGPRAPLLHIKDGPAVRDEPQVAVGQGTLDFPAIVRAGGDTTEWLIVELDHCATDMQEAVEASFDYLVQAGLGHGREG
jgi:sugar phosphate isomerase/epimerase